MSKSETLDWQTSIIQIFNGSTLFSWQKCTSLITWMKTKETTYTICSVHKYSKPLVFRRTLWVDIMMYMYSITRHNIPESKDTRDFLTPNRRLGCYISEDSQLIQEISHYVCITIRIIFISFVKAELPIIPCSGS